MIRLSLVLVLVFLVSSTHAQVRIGSWTETKGNSHIGVTGSFGSSAAKWVSPARVDIVGNGSCTATIFGHTVEVSGFELTGTSTSSPSRAVLRLSGQTVLSHNATGTSSHIGLPITTRDAFSWRPTRVFSVGPVDVRLAATAGTGGQISGTWTRRTSAPVRCDLVGGCQTFAYATGRVSIDFLWGAGDVSLTAEVDLLNRTLHVDAMNTQISIAACHANAERLTWRLRLKLKLRLLGIEIASRTILDESGGFEARNLY